MTEDFPIQLHRGRQTMMIMMVLGVFAALAGVISGLTRGISPLDRPIPLLVLLLGVPAIWIVALGILATFSLRITEDSVQKVLWRRWVVVSRPLSQLRSASVAQNTIELRFTDGSTIRIAAMPLRDLPRLETLLTHRCPNLADPTIDL